MYKIMTLVTPRMRCVSRNTEALKYLQSPRVTPRMRCVSRNDKAIACGVLSPVTPRMRCVSRNIGWSEPTVQDLCHTSHEVCE